MAPVKKPFDVIYAARLYMQGQSVQEIADAAGDISHTTVWRRLQDHGVPMRTRGVRKERLALVQTALRQLDATINPRKKVLALMETVPKASAREISIATAMPYRAVSAIMQTERARRAKAAQ